MTKFLSYLSAFLLVAVYILSGIYLNQKKQINALETEKSVIAGNNEYLEAEIEKRNEAALDADKRRLKIEKAAETAKDTGGFNWSNPLPADDVTRRLRQD